LREDDGGTMGGQKGKGGRRREGKEEEVCELSFLQSSTPFSRVER